MTIQKSSILWAGFFIFLFSTNGIEAQEKDISSQITLANESYHEKDYETATGIFENLIAQGQINGYLYYNLGNTYMRLGRTGHAILNYLHAKSLLPRNENLDANLRYAISQTSDQLNPPQGGFISGLLFWVESISLIEHFQLLILFNVIFWSVSVGFLYYRKPSWKTLKKISLAILLLVFFSAGIKYYFQFEQKIGVVLESKVGVKSDRGTQDITLFELHEGAIISVNEANGEWVHISLDKDKNGWVPLRSVGY